MTVRSRTVPVGPAQRTQIVAVIVLETRPETLFLDGGIRVTRNWFYDARYIVNQTKQRVLQ